MMTTQMETSTRQGRSVVYIVAVVVLVVLALIGLFTFRSARQTQQAGEKADQLIEEIEAAGGTAPSREQIMGVLGDDGGAVCTDPNEALSRATFLSQLANGAGGPGARPVVADNSVVEGQLLIIEIYCPDEAAEFEEFTDTLETADLSGE